MILTQERQAVHLDSGVQAETVMTVSEDAADAIIILQNMTDLYSIKSLAGIREVASNAWDAHVMSGQTRPILVWLPKMGPNPEFIVQDFGLGLNAEDLRNIYAKFGKSTKRTHATATGCLGLGCKAPLTYCLSFTVVGVKDGIKTIAVVTKNEHGVGTIKVMSEVETDEPNGVTVTLPVPASDVESFSNHAKTFFSFWRSGVLIDGEEPETVECLIEIDPDIWVIPVKDSYRREKSYVVQGNVPYPYETKVGLPPTVTWVPMSTIDFVPSREALQHTELTDDTIATIQEYIQATLARIIDFELDACPTSYERIKKIRELQDTLPNGYKHPKLRNVRQDLRCKRGKNLWTVSHDTASKGDEIDAWSIGVDRYGKDRGWSYITGFPFKGVSARHKEMVKAAGIEEPYYLIQSGAGIALDGFPGRSWSSIPEIPKAERKRVEAAPREETRYHFYIDGEYRMMPKYEGDLPLLWTGSEQTTAVQVSRFFKVATISAQITQKDRVTRLHPNLVEDWRAWADSEIRGIKRRLTKADHRYLTSTQWERSLSRTFEDNVKRVKDPALRALMNYSASEHLKKLIRIQSEFGNVIGYAVDQPLWDAIRTLRSGGAGRPPEDHYVRTTYPMLYADRYSNVIDAPVDDLIIYLNAKFAAVKKAAKNSAPDDTAQAA